MATEGSDCPRGGKRQFATKQAASSAASGMRTKGYHTYAYKCPWCGCFHVGNRRSWSSKNRGRNIRR